MTQEQKRIKLAEAAGFTQEEPWLDGRKCWGHKKHPKHIGFEEIPDYFNDLNAVHELWASLPRATRLIVVARLADILKLPKGNQNEIGELEEALFSASAAQRATAIGLTLNLWK